MKIDWQKLKLGLEKRWLHLEAGLFWAFAGGMLLHFATGWITGFTTLTRVLAVTGGSVLALIIYWYGFSRLAKKNIVRIDNIPSQRPCIFAFQKWSSYPLVIVMISMGIFLRKHSGLPTYLLAPMYLGLGGSLFLSSLLYFQNIWQKSVHPL
ncbi:hypothetical protein KQH61_00765 [bacterium]|nr:hypothetical protein [bacterium]